MAPSPTPLPAAGGELRSHCQVLVVGAGPAGGELARQLAQAGVDVQLVDQLADLTQAAFSSAALPLEAMDRYGLPAELAAARWSRWQLIGPGGAEHHWHADAPLGVVLDFGALRCWLADQCRRWGAAVALGWKAIDCRPHGQGYRTRLRHRHGAEQEVFSAWVVDASGQQRALIGEATASPEPLVMGLGCEWLVQLPPPLWQCWSERLVFCLGSDWVEQGYGWVFPMLPGQLKLGVCRLADPGRRQPPLGAELERMITRLFPGEEQRQLTILDRHGGRIRSRIRRRDPHRRGRLLALGDAVSTANLLGGEGIRHALASSRVLAPLLLEAIANDTPSGRTPSGRVRRRSDRSQRLRSPASRDPIATYPQALRQKLGWRWGLSGRLAQRTWLGLHTPSADRRLQRLLVGLEGCSAEDLSALLFDYRFERYGLRALPYLLGWR